MIRPSTTVFALVTADAQDAWLARLYNALFGFNGLDAAAVVFTIRPEHLPRVLTGLLDGGRAHYVHVAPSLWQDAARAVGSNGDFVDAIDPRTGPRFEHLERLVAFARPRTVGLLEPPRPSCASARLASLLLACGALPSGGDVAVDVTLPGEPLRPVDTAPSEVFLAASWALVPERRRAWPESTELGPSFQLFVQRAGDELQARFGLEPRAPADLAQALVERSFRPCQLIDDGFRAAYPHLGVGP